jgi:dihydropteroate synthase
MPDGTPAAPGPGRAGGWRFRWRGGPTWGWEDGLRLVGVVNVTPDSFTDGGRYLDPGRAAEHALRLVAEGADAVDVGAESTRPGHVPVPWQEEWERLAPALRRIRAEVAVPVSVDTRHAEVARRALDAGAQAVNDVSGLADPAMVEVVARAGAAVVVGHWRPRRRPWRPRTVRRQLERARAALLAAGVSPDAVALDPGLGFGKTGADNWRLLAHLGTLTGLGSAVMVGASRKRFAAALSGDGDAADEMTAYVTLWAALAGAAMARVHAPGPSARARAVARALAAGRRDGG